MAAGAGWAVDGGEVEQKSKVKSPGMKPTPGAPGGKEKGRLGWRTLFPLLMRLVYFVRQNAWVCRLRNERNRFVNNTGLVR
jgi:hypothetical protein